MLPGGGLSSLEQSLTSSEWATIRLIAMSMAALVAVVGAVFAFLDALSKPDEQTRVRGIFQQYWETVRRTPLLSMPGRLVRLILGVRHIGEAVTEWVVTSDRGSTIVGSIGGITAVIVLLIGLPRARPYIVGWSLVSLLANWSKARSWRIIGALGFLDDLGGFLIAVGGFVVLIQVRDDGTIYALGHLAGADCAATWSGSNGLCRWMAARAQGQFERR